MNWVNEVQRALIAVADPAKVRPMQGYMKDIAPFLGIAAPQRRAAVKSLGYPAADEVLDVARALWALPEREYAYVACDYLERASHNGPVDMLTVVDELARSKSWWDTVDSLAHVTANLVAANASLGADMERWIVDENMWIARIAMLHQLGRKEATDTERLFRFCLVQAPSREFFLRKAIGWALRDYAWTDPSAVSAFVDEHRRTLSALSIREAVKNVEKASARFSTDA